MLAPLKENLRVWVPLLMHRPALYQSPAQPQHCLCARCSENAGPTQDRPLLPRAPGDTKQHWLVLTSSLWLDPKSKVVC